MLEELSRDDVDNSLGGWSPCVPDHRGTGDERIWRQEGTLYKFSLP